MLGRIGPSLHIYCRDGPPPGLRELLLGYGCSCCPLPCEFMRCGGPLFVQCNFRIAHRFSRATGSCRAFLHGLQCFRKLLKLLRKFSNSGLCFGRNRLNLELCQAPPYLLDAFKLSRVEFKSHPNSTSRELCIHSAQKLVALPQGIIDFFFQIEAD